MRPEASGAFCIAAGRPAPEPVLLDDALPDNHRAFPAARSASRRHCFAGSRIRANRLESIIAMPVRKHHPASLTIQPWVGDTFGRGAPAVQPAACPEHRRGTCLPVPPALNVRRPGNGTARQTPGSLEPCLLIGVRGQPGYTTHPVGAGTNKEIFRCREWIRSTPQPDTQHSTTRG
jgi:hypothetical protein